MMTSVETDDRWIVPLRGHRVARVGRDDTVTLAFEPDAEITVGGGAFWTQGSIGAPGAVKRRVAELGDEEVQELVGVPVLSAVCFKSGSLRVVFGNGRHLNAEPASTLAGAVVRIGDTVWRQRPGGGWETGQR
ncbi:DUF6188 family protein [Streptomyces sp. NPDC054813]